MRIEIAPVIEDDAGDAPLRRRESLPLRVSFDDGPWNRTADLTPVDGLWRLATAPLRTSRSAPSPRNLAEVMDGIERETGSLPHVAIPVHDGYMIVYGRHAVPWSRILHTTDGFVVRIFDPHASRTFAHLSEAVDFARHPEAA